MRRERQVLGLGETRGISSLISEMTLRERRALHEAVKGMILLEQSGSVEPNPWEFYDGDFQGVSSEEEARRRLDTSPRRSASTVPAPAAPAAASDDIGFALGRETGKYVRPKKPITASGELSGFEIFDSAGNPILRKTGQGWKITARLSDDEVLAMVVPGARAEVSRGLKNRSRGQEYEIAKEILLKPEIANSPAVNPAELKLEREGTFLTDPVIITDQKAQEIIDSLGQVVHIENVAAKEFVNKQRVPGTYVLGDAYFIMTSTGVQIEIPRTRNFAGFTDIFGYDSNIAELIAKTQRKAGTDKKLRIPLKLATERSVIRMLSKSIFSVLGIGAISFETRADKFVSDEIPMDAEKQRIFTERLTQAGATQKSSE